jgi:hypothetical protein
MAQLNIMPELDLDHDNEGYVRMGPIKGVCTEALMEKMDMHGVFAFPEGAEVLTERDANGDLFITAIDEEVHGYFLADDNHEAATSDSDELLLSLLSEGEIITMEGSYPNGTGGLIQTSSRYLCCDGTIYRDIERLIVQPCGSTTEIMKIQEVRELELAAQSAKSGGNVVSLCCFRRTKAA